MSSYLIEVSKQNKEDLLGKAIGRGCATRKKAEELLNEISRLNPTLAQDFGLKETALEDLKLRVLCYPEPGRHVHYVSSYLIISYCWHKPDWPRHLDEPKVAKEWEIYEPMVEKIKSLRKSKDEGIWLDKLCIKQGPEYEEERTAQVGSMDIIYRSARRMLILLEDIQFSEGECLAGHLWSNMYKQMSESVQKGNSEGAPIDSLISKFWRSNHGKVEDELRSKNYDAQLESRRFIMRLLGARWFTRAWCAHESRVVPHLKENNPLFLCFGSKKNIVTFEYRFIMWLSQRFRYEEGMRGQLDLPDPAVFQQRQLRLAALYSNGHEERSMVEHMSMISDTGCEREEDLITIALNTTEIPLFYRKVKISHPEIFWVFAVLSLASGDAIPLVLFGENIQMLDVSGKRELVSWLQIPDHQILENRLPISLQGSISSVKKDYIELDLLLFQQTPSKPSAEALREANRLVDKHELQKVSEEFAQNDSEPLRTAIEKLLKLSRETPGQSLLMDFLPAILAFALENGLEWIRRFPNVMLGCGEDSFLDGEFRNNDERLEEAAGEVLTYLGIEKSEDNTGMNSIVLFLSIITDNKIKTLTIWPWRIQVANDDWGFTEPIAEKSWIAVPVAAANLPYPTKRAWVLELFDSSTDREGNVGELYEVHKSNCRDDGSEVERQTSTLLISDCKATRSTPDTFMTRSWRLQKRQVIYGSQTIAADDKFVKCLPRQRVYGANTHA